MDGEEGKSVGVGAAVYTPIYILCVQGLSVYVVRNCGIDLRCDRRRSGTL